MPVTAKLSRKFYDTLGDEVANEMVDWFNAVDTGYRSELREMNQANQSWFSARLGQGMAELTSAFRTELAAQGVELRREIQAQGVELRKDIQAQGIELRQEIHAQGVDFRRELAEVRMSIEALDGRSRAGMAALRADLIKWMFLFWIGSVGAVVATRLWQ